MSQIKQKNYLTNQELAERFEHYDYDNSIRVMFDKALIEEDLVSLEFIAATLSKLDINTVRLFMAYVHGKAEQLSEQIIDMENTTLTAEGLVRDQTKTNIIRNKLHLINMYFGGETSPLHINGDYANPRVVNCKLTEEEKTAIIKSYNKKQAELKIRKKLKFMRPRFLEGEIVGALDKENKWWLARILQVIKYEGGYAYYVEFCNWGSQFNDLISDPRKIRWYNPRRHKLFRGIKTTNKGVDLNELENNNCELDDNRKIDKTNTKNDKITEIKDEYQNSDDENDQDFTKDDQDFTKEKNS